MGSTLFGATLRDKTSVSAGSSRPGREKPAARAAKALALTALGWVTPMAQAETLSADWTISGHPDTGTVFVVIDGNYITTRYLILTPFVALSQVVNLAVGQYRVDYRGDPLVTGNGSPTTLAPAISTAADPGTVLSAFTPSFFADLSFFFALPSDHSDIYTITQSGAATITFTFATQGCDTSMNWIFSNGWCAAVFDHNSVVLTLLSLSPIAGLLPADTPQNAMNVVQEIDPFAGFLDIFPLDFVDLYELATEDQVTGLLQLSGELGTGIQQSRLDADDGFMAAMFASAFGDKTGMGDGAQVTRSDMGGAESGPHFWANVHGSAARQSGSDTSGASDLSTRYAGLALGGEYQLSPDTQFGFAVGATQMGYSVTGGSGHSTLLQAAINLRQEFGTAYVAGGLGFGTGSTSTERVVTISGIDRLEADFNARSTIARLEAGFDLQTAGSDLTPFVAYQSASLRLPAYGETATSGDDTFALDYEAQKVRNRRTELGLRWTRSWDGARGVKLVGASATWVHNLDTDRSAVAGFPSLAGSSFEVTGAEASKNVLLLSLNGKFAGDTGWVASGNLTGALGGNSFGFSAGVKLELTF